MVEWKFLSRRDNGTRGREYKLGRDIQGDARRKEIFGGRDEVNPESWTVNK